MLVSPVTRVPRRKRRKVFRVEEMWFQDETCTQTCREAWNKRSGNPSPCQLKNQLADCRNELQVWEGDHFGNIKKQLLVCKREMDIAQRGQVNPEQAVMSRMLESKMEDLLRKEEIMWRQRSRNSWLAEGDKNTSYFHRTATGRKKRNFISHITRADGVVVRKEEEIEEVFRSYFVDLFKAGEQIEMTEALEAVDPVVSAEMNNQLKQPFTLEDIATSLTQMHSLKAPGPDGMSALFFKKTWSFVHDDLCASLLKILNEGADPSCLNDTFICLIPKKKKSDLPKDFRPISLCNVVYKLLSKTIVNRLKHALPSIINETQSAFVPGRLISDNALLAFETFHFFKLNKAKKRLFCF